MAEQIPEPAENPYEAPQIDVGDLHQRRRPAPGWDPILVFIAATLVVIVATPFALFMLLFVVCGAVAISGV